MMAVKSAAFQRIQICQKRFLDQISLYSDRFLVGQVGGCWRNYELDCYSKSPTCVQDPTHDFITFCFYSAKRFKS